MAQIYQPQGQRVDLAGPSADGGFRPVQAFDPTSQVAAAQNRQLTQYENIGKANLEAYSGDLKSLTQFSDTLNKMVVDEGKVRMENDINIGIGQVLDGTISTTPEAQKFFEQKSAILDGAATAQIQTSNNIAQTNVPLAETIVTSSPAVNQWITKGRAIGVVMKAGGEAKPFFQEWLKSTVPSIPIPDGKGGMTLLAPSQVRSAPELSAAWSVGLQQFIQQSNLRDISPSLLVKYLTPTLLELKGTLLANRMAEIRETRQDNENEAHAQKISVQAKGLADRTVVQNLWNTNISEAAIRFGGNYKQANEFVFGNMVKSIEFVSQTDPTLATTMVTNLGSTLINPDKPELGTIADRFPGELSKIIGTIKGTKREAAQAKADADKQQVDDIFQTVVNAQETGDITKSRAAFDAGEKALTDLSNQNVSGATDALRRLRERTRNYNAITNKRFGEAVEKGIIRTQAQAQEYRSLGLITDATYNAYAPRLLTDRSEQEMKLLQPALEDYAYTILGENLGGTGADFSKFKTNVGHIVRPAILEVMAEFEKTKSKALAEGKEAPSEKVLADAKDQLKAMFGKGGRYEIKVGDKGRLIYPPLGAGKVSVVPRQKGQSGIDMSSSLLSRLPVIASASADKFNISEERLANVLEIASAGGKIPDDILARIRTTGVSVDAFLSSQAPKFGLTYVPQAKAKQLYDDNRALDARAAGLLINPRTTPEQRIQANIDLIAARRRREQQQPSPSQSSISGANDYGGLLKLISSGEGGYDSYNIGIAGKDTGARPLSKMRLGDVQTLQRNGTVSAVGVGQWMPDGQLDMAIKAAGLGPNDIFSPENQQKMFWAYVLNTNKRPALKNYLMGKSNDLRSAHQALADEWAAVKGPNGRGSYDNDRAGNMASLDHRQISAALMAARKAIMAGQQP